MRITPCTPEALRARIADVDAEVSDAVWRERLRCEVSARGTTSRTALVASTIDRWTLDPGRREALRPQLGERVDDLVDDREIYAADGGLIAPAPLVKICVNHAHRLLVGSVPTPVLDAALGGRVRADRRVRLAVCASNDEAFARAIDGLGGLSTGLNEWAEWPQHTHSTTDWHECLNARGRDGGPRSDLPDGDAEAYVAEGRNGAANHRWRPLQPGPGQRLVRVRRPFGWLYRWTAGGEWWVALTASEAHRTVAMLDAESRIPKAIRVVRDGDAVCLTTEAMLPREEYRVALAVCDRVERADSARVFRVPAGVAPEFTSILSDRLWLRIEGS